MPRKKNALLKKISEEFASLTEKKKKKYDQMAEEAKETYKAELEKYNQENPHMEIKKPQGKSARKSVKTPRNKIITPFYMFMNEKRSIGVDASLPELRAMWEELEKKQRYKYIQQCFQQQSTDKPLKLTKEEQSIVEYASGKPEPVPHTVCDFYLKKQANPPKSTQMSVWRKEKMAEYKSLPKVQKLELELEHRRAKMEFVQKYQEYISNLPDEDVQRMENEQLQSFIASKLDKDEQRKYRQDTLSTMLDGTSTALYSEMPIAESTTHDIQLSKPKKKKAANADSSMKPPTTAAAAATAISKSNGKQQKSQSLKNPPPTTIAESPSKRKQKELASSPAVGASKKQKKQVEQVDSDTNSEKADKKPTVTNGVEEVREEPVRPPKTVQKYYKQYYYHGKPGKSKESFEKLSDQRKEAIQVEMRKAQKKYYKDLHKFFKHLPSDQVDFHLKKLQIVEGGSFLEDGDITGEETADDTTKQPRLAKGAVRTKQEPQSSDDDKGAKKANAATSNKTTNVSSSDDDDTDDE
uniref:HMG box domain-containing protein n=1 Tax=Anopheles dirus TaxID=7168 RepID=A0A182NGP7_9DIPT